MQRVAGLSTKSMQLGLLGSLCLHLSITLWMSATPTRPSPPARAEVWPPAVDVQLGTEPFGLRQTTRVQTLHVTEQRFTGSLRTSGADTWQLGGQTGGVEKVVNLGSRIGERAIRDVDPNNLALDQLQRIRTSRERRSAQQARQTPNPASAAVLSSGAGVSDARHKPSRAKASASSTEQLDHGTAVTAERIRKTEVPVAPVERQASETRPSRASKRAVSSMTLRPDIAHGRAATDTEWHARTPADNIDSTSASTLVDRGVEQTATKPGHDGVGVGDEHQLPGARALASSPLRGPVQGPVGNAAYDHWLAKQKKAIGDALRFPKARILSFDQGMSVFELLVSQDGRVLQGPSLIRSSGFADFDSEGRRAIKATRLSPLPRSLVVGERPVRVTMVVSFFNPMTH